MVLIAESGVGERRRWSGNAGEYGEALLPLSPWGKEGEANTTGKGVDIPSALASLASLCGGRGDFGAAHDVEAVLVVGDNSEEEDESTAVTVIIRILD